MIQKICTFTIIYKNSSERGKRLKEKLQNFNKAVKRELKENKSTFWVYTGLRLLVIGMMILQIFNKNFENVFLCLLTLMLMLMPSVLQATLKIEFPSLLEIIILVFIFAAEILGEISAFYMKFPYWDTILHTLNGFLCAAIGFSLVDIMNRERKLKFEMSPLFMAITAFCFSMTIGVLWEFLEFGVDTFCNLDMQKDTVITAISSTYLDPTQTNQCMHIDNITDVMINGNSLNVGGYLDIGLHDTMFDLIVNFIGAVVFSVMGFFYVKKQNAKGVVDGLVPQPWSEEKRAGTDLTEEKRKNRKKG